MVVGGAEDVVVDHHELVVPNRDYGLPAVELLDADAPEDAVPIAEAELERLRILARTPRLGRELDDRVMPAEAGLVERAISFTKGCYPGQEPVARLHHRGHPNRGLRVVAIEGSDLPIYDAELALDGKAVGRVTSAAPDSAHGVVALAYIRREVPSRRRPRSRRPARPPARGLSPTPARRYTHPSRARSSGDRAQPCGG